MHQEVAAPAVLNGLPNVPFPFDCALDVIEYPNIVASGNLCNKLLHNLLVWPSLR